MTSVWVKLYIGEDDTKTSVFGIHDFTGNIDQLKQAIKQQEQLDCPASRLIVYHPGTDITEFNDESKKYSRLSAPPPSDTTDDSPVIVVAPPLLQQQQQVSPVDLCDPAGANVFFCVSLISS